MRLDKACNIALEIINKKDRNGLYKIPYNQRLRVYNDIVRMLFQDASTNSFESSLKCFAKRFKFKIINLLRW